MENAKVKYVFKLDGMTRESENIKNLFLAGLNSKETSPCSLWYFINVFGYDSAFEGYKIVPHPLFSVNCFKELEDPCRKKPLSIPYLSPAYK